MFGSRFSGTTRMGYSPASTPFGIDASRSTSPSATPISCSHRAMTTLWSGRRHVAFDLCVAERPILISLYEVKPGASTPRQPNYGASCITRCGKNDIPSWHSV